MTARPARIPKIAITTLVTLASVGPGRVAFTRVRVSIQLQPWLAVRQDHDLDISVRVARCSLTGPVLKKAMINNTGATINTSHVMLIAVTSNR